MSDVSLRGQNRPEMKVGGRISRVILGSLDIRGHHRSRSNPGNPSRLSPSRSPFSIRRPTRYNCVSIISEISYNRSTVHRRFVHDRELGKCKHVSLDDEVTTLLKRCGVGLCVDSKPSQHVSA